MRQWLIRLGVLVCVVLVLVAGGLFIGQRNGLICFSQGSSGPPTTTTGPVTMSTDHSVYAPSDTITVTISNHLNTTIVLLSAASETCPIFVLSKLGYGPLTPCHEGRDVGPSVAQTSVPANGTGGVSFDSANLAIPLTDGTYQVETQWVPFPLRDSPSDASRHATSIASQTFRVCTCRIC